MSNSRYKENSERVREIYGVGNSKKYNIHHICDRYGYKQGDYGEDFDIDGKANLIPLPIEDHNELHRRIQQLEGMIKKEGRKTKKKKKR